MERLSHTHANDTSELLSAYADDAVDIVERRRAEGYVQSCEACAQELRELRLFKQLLHELPYIQPQRSFTLDPATAPRPRWLLFPTFRLASLVASLLLLVVLGVDGLSSQRSGSAQTNTVTEPGAYQIQRRSDGFSGAAGTGTFGDAAAAASTAAAPAAAQAPPITAASAAASTAGAPESASVESAAQAQSATGAAAATGASAASTAAESGDAAGSLPVAPPMPTPVVLNTAVANALPSEPQSDANEPGAGNDAAQLPPGATAVAGSAADEEQLQSAPAVGIDTEILSGNEQRVRNRAPNTLRIIEAVLGLTAIVFGIAAFIAWRRRL